MGKEFTNLTDEELCELMCGEPERDYDDEEESCVDNTLIQNAFYKST